MELRHLRYFVAVADELSFTRGAEKLRIAQPSLTRQIRDLEDELGTRLLDRTKKKVTLTREGQFFLDRAKRLLGLSAEMVQSVHELDRTINHTVNIGYVPNPFHRVLPASLTAFEKAFPDVSINLFGMPSAEQIHAVKEGKLDVGFIGLFDPVKDSELEFLVVGSYQGVVLLPRGSSFAKGGSFRLKDLGRTFLVALAEKCYPGYRRWLDATCQRIGIQAKVVEVLESDTALIQAVRSGLGIALLPEQIRDVPHDNIVIRAVTPPILFSSAIVWKKGYSAAGLKVYLETVISVTSGKPLVT
jgi:LysR family transcriptional regulator, hca operon transcriptional activator